MSAGAALDAPKRSSPPLRAPPPGACDSHTHIFGPEERFPFAGGGTYTPPFAPYEDYRAMHAVQGVARGVVVQPAAYLSDHRAILDACARAGGAVRGIGSSTAAISDDDLAALRAGGIVGLRFIEVADPVSGGRFKGAVGFDDLLKLAPRMKALGMQAHVWADCERLAADAALLQSLEMPIVVDHMARPHVSAGVGAPAFQKVLHHVADGLFWVKLAVCRVSPDLADARPFHDALIAANPDCVVWASDWPHVRMGAKAPDVGRLIDLFDEWIAGDETLRRKIFVDNPARLFGFEERR